MPPPLRPPRRGVSYSEQITAAYATAPEAEIVFETLEFQHSLFKDDGVQVGIRVVNNHEPLVAYLEPTAPLNPGAEVTFRPAQFKAVRQSESASGQMPEFSLQIDNAARILMPYLEIAQHSDEPVIAIYRPYCLSDLSGPHMIPVIKLTVEDVAGDMQSITATLGFSRLTNRRFPSIEYTARLFPWLTLR